MNLKPAMRRFPLRAVAHFSAPNVSAVIRLSAETFGAEKWDEGQLDAIPILA